MFLWKDSVVRPFFVLAPLEGVTDTVFRRIIASCARPDIFFTEFTSADGLCSVGRNRVMESLRFTAQEQPIVAQLWGRSPDTMYRACRLVAPMGFAGIDINMGCPDRAVVKSGAGAALIGDTSAASAIIAAARRGIADAGVVLPLSVKTRIGKTKPETDTWIPFLLDAGVDAITIHGRTAKELSKCFAHWDEIAQAVVMRDRIRPETVIIGNGDIADVREATRAAKEYGVDGVMIGRGILKNPWAFARDGSHGNPTPGELIDIMERHIMLFEKTWGKKKNFAILRKYFKIYVNGFSGAVQMRERAMQVTSVDEARRLVHDIREAIGV